MIKTEKLKVKSLSLFIPVENVLAEIYDLGFKEMSSATIIADNKFWSKKVFKKEQEFISVSDEIGDADYLRDPIVTMFGKQKTINALSKLE